MVNNFPYTIDNKRYHTLTYFYQHKFGCKIAKVSLNANFSCPNIDGTKSYGGCIFCSKSGSGDFAGDVNDSLMMQFIKGKKLMQNKWPNAKFIAYFQARTNTYADVETLKEKYETILKLDNVVGLSIATRPDAISPECLKYLTELNKKTFLIVELGLQSSNNNTLNFINRGHNSEVFRDAVKRLHERNIFVVAHIINGLPYEAKEDMLNTIKFVNDCGIDGIKIHMLYVAKNTPLASIYEKDKFHILTKEEYIDIVCDQLRLLNKDVVIMRITGDPTIDELIAPDWLIKKFVVLNDIDKEMLKRNIYQGDLV